MPSGIARGKPLAAAAAEKVGKKPTEVQAEARKELEAQRKLG